MLNDVEKRKWKLTEYAPATRYVHFVRLIFTFVWWNEKSLKYVSTLILSFSSLSRSKPAHFLSFYRAPVF